MNPAARWARMLLALAAILLVLGIGPMLVVALLLPGAQTFIPELALLSVAPLGAIALVAGLIAWVVGRLRR